MTAASLGNLGTSKPVCKAGSYDLTKGDDNIKAGISLDCPFGTLFAITEFGQLSREVAVDCDNATEFIGSATSAFSFYPSSCDYKRFI